MGDWLTDLGEFAAQHVAAACQEWRQSEAGTRRPTPANIRMLTIAEMRKHTRRPKPPQVTDMHRQPIPAADVVREGWRKIPRSLLTAAELVLLEESVPASTKRALEAVAAGAVRAVPTAQGEARRLPEIKPHALPPEDDPAVQAELRRMGG